MRVSTGLPPGPILSKNKTYVSEKMMKLTVTINLIIRILIYIIYIEFTHSIVQQIIQNLCLELLFVIICVNP